jgi:prevent-host-death family protein
MYIMKRTVNVATLRQELSKYLHIVEEQGDEIVITAHRRPVARLTSDRGNGLDYSPSTVSRQAIRKLKGVHGLPDGFSAEALLYEDRHRR